jgi:hypothetical protein
MQGLNLSKLFLTIAGLIIQIHAVLPHCHLPASEDIACLQSTEENSEHHHWPCHPDLGEHHLENLTAQQQAFSFIHPQSIEITPQIVSVVTEHIKPYWQSTICQQLHLARPHPHRGPPIFA